MSEDSFTRESILAAERAIRPYIRRTPVLEVAGRDFEGVLGENETSIALKLELCQHAGSFKTRGAFTNLLSRSIPAAVVAAASGGNHGAAVAYAARRLGVRARIFVPSISSPAKIARIRECGADLVVGGDRYADALAACETYIAESGALGIHAFDDVETIRGQATLAAEFEEQTAFDTVLVAVGGGGLVAGIAAWFAGAKRVIAVEPEGAPTLTRALAAGRPVDAETGSVAADSLAPKRVGERVFPLAKAYVERVVLVDDAAIRASQRALWSNARIVAEPGGAAAFAALLSGRYVPRPGERVAVVVSGGNTVAVDFDR